MKDFHKKESPILSLQSLGGGANSLSFGAAGADKGWYLYHGCDTATPSSGYPNANSDYGRQVRVDSSGNIYVQHSSYLRVNWAKFDNDGALQWNRMINGDAWPGGSYGNSGTGVEDERFQTNFTVDSSGNLYVVSHTNSMQTGGSDTVPSGTGQCADVYLAKYNSSGTLQWQQSFGSGPLGGTGNGGYSHSRNEHGLGITTDPYGNVYVAGFVYRAYQSYQYTDLLVVKFNSSGSVTWQKAVQGDETSGNYNYRNRNPVGSTITWIGNRVYIGGRINVNNNNTSGTMTLVCVLNSTNGSLEYWHAAGGKYHSYHNFDGSMMECGHSSIGQSSPSGSHSIRVTSSGTVYAISNDLGSYGSPIVHKFNALGGTSFDWSRRLGVAYNETTYKYISHGLTIDSSNNVIISGWKRTSSSDGNGCTSETGFIIKLNDSDGSTDWEVEFGAEAAYNVGQSWGCDKGCRLHGLDIDSDDFIYVVGRANNFTSAGSNTNMVLFKLPSDGSFFPSDGSKTIYGTAPYNFYFKKITSPVNNDATSVGGILLRNSSNGNTPNGVLYTPTFTVNPTTTSFTESASASRSTSVNDWIYP